MSQKINTQLSLDVGEEKLESAPPRPALPPKLDRRPEFDGIRLRFWPKVKKGEPNECWEWQAAIGTRGYGQFAFLGANRRTHRVTWILEYGFIPDQLHVLHTCDNRRCCNPSHLFLGTNLDNVADRCAKNRSADMEGESNSNAKLSEADVLQIFELRKSGIVTKEIARRYGVTIGHIYQILGGRQWSSLKTESKTTT
jgi:hypothetical protein